MKLRKVLNMLKEQQEDYNYISDRMDSMIEFLVVIQQSIRDGGRIVTFGDQDIMTLDSLIGDDNGAFCLVECQDSSDSICQRETPCEHRSIEL